MIIELYGPPGAGKTTFAHALTKRLRDNGHSIELMLSYRPAEVRSTSVQWPSRPARPRTAVVPQRLSRPVLEVLSIVRHPYALAQNVRPAADLMRMVPPRNMTAAVRLSQYILRLSHSWHRASASSHIVLFDQAFVQFICSLVLLSRSPDGSLIADALDAAPRSDLAIRLDAPREVLAARLKDRDRRQSSLERLFELDLETNLKSIEIIDELHRLLTKQNRPVVIINSLNQQSLSEGVKAAEETVAGLLAAARQSPTGASRNAFALMDRVAT